MTWKEENYSASLLSFCFSDAATLHVGRSTARECVHVNFIVGAASIAQWHAGTLAIVLVLDSLCRGQDFAVSTMAGHGLGLSVGIIDHCWKLATACIDEPVGDLICGAGLSVSSSQPSSYAGQLTHLQAGLPHQLLLLVLGRVRMVQVSHEPSAELISSLLGQVATTFSLLVVASHSHTQLANPHISVLERMTVSAWSERCAVHGVY